MKYFHFLLPVVILLISCNNNGVDEIHCDFDRTGTYESSLLEDFSFQYTNLVSPDVAELFQLGIAVAYRNPDIDMIAISSSDIKVYDSDDNEIYKSSSHNDIDSPTNSNSHYEVIHLWDCNVDGMPFYGEFSFDLDLGFENGETLTLRNYRSLSYSCEKMKDCAEGCDLAKCRGIGYLYLTSGFDPIAQGLLTACF